MGEQNYRSAQRQSSYHTTAEGSISGLMNQLTIRPASFGEIPDAANVLLLTPYLHQPPPNAPPALAMDPFEPFGRELTEHHARIRHVPYVPKRGMIEMHRSLMREAGGVIVVMCEA